MCHTDKQYLINMNQQENIWIPQQDREQTILNSDDSGSALSKGYWWKFLFLFRFLAPGDSAADNIQSTHLKKIFLQEFLHFHKLGVMQPLLQEEDAEHICDKNDWICIV